MTIHLQSASARASQKSCSILVYCSLILCMTAAILLSGTSSAKAAIEEKDMQVILRALAFQENPPSGTLTMAILYDPSVSASQSDANKAQSILSGGYSAKGITIQPQMVSVSSINNISNADLVYVTDGMSAHYSKVSSITSGKGILTVGTDKACVTAGGCIMFVQSTPSVEIVVNITSASESQVKFKSAFRMMIDEI